MELGAHHHGLALHPGPEVEVLYPAEATGCGLLAGWPAGVPRACRRSPVSRPDPVTALCMLAWELGPVWGWPWGTGRGTGRAPGGLRG